MGIRTLRWAAIAFIPALFQTAAQAQNPCGYAYTIMGQQLFADHCAGCHGKDGRGKGSPAEKPAADLTAIAKRNGGAFPSERVSETIRFGGRIPEHETAQGSMPVWGKVFNGECGPAYSRRAVVELKRYLEALQR
jgi:mono/diheme cytochrome c family protein